MKTPYLFYWMIGLVFLFPILACEESVEWELDGQTAGLLVVDAIITSEITRQEIRLSLSTSEMNGVAVQLEDAKVRVLSNRDTFLFVATQPGLYRSIRPFGAKRDTLYHLEVWWEGERYSASSQWSKVFPLEDIVFNRKGETDSLEIISVGPGYDPEQQAMYEIDLDWGDPFFSDSTRQAKLFFYTFNTIDINELVPPGKEKVFFPKGTLLIETKYGVEEEFGAYLRAVVMETEWQGGVFDEASSSVPTNISNGGLGFFSVCGIRRDSMIVR